MDAQREPHLDPVRRRSEILAAVPRATRQRLGRTQRPAWLDVEQAVLIAVNRILGDDVAIALDYRTNPADPRVVASDFWTNPHQCSWRTVTPTFSEFVRLLQLN
jgi:hypothetical protein